MAKESRDALLLLQDVDRAAARGLAWPGMLIVEAEGRWLAPRSGLRVERAGDLVAYSRLLALNLEAKHIARSWYRDGEVDHTLWPDLGVSVGECLRFKAGVALSRFLRHLALVDALAEQGCARVSVYGEPSPLLAEANRQGAVRVRFVRLGWKPRLRSLRRVAGKVRREVRRMLAPVMPRWGVAAAAPLPAAVHAGGDAAALYALPDVVLDGFMRTLADELKAELYQFDVWRGSEPWGGAWVAAQYSRRAREITSVSAFHRVCDAVAPWFHRVFATWVERELPGAAVAALGWGAGFGEFLTRRKIDVALLPMPWMGYRRAQLQIAQKLGVPVVVLQDGILLDHDLMSLPEVNADYALLLGESGRQWFSKAGMAPENMLAVGPLLWGQEWCAEAPENKLDERTGLVHVLYLAPPPEEHSAQFSRWEADEEIEKVARGIALNPRLKLLVRFHPRIRFYVSKDKDWPATTERRLRAVLQERVEILEPGQTLHAALHQADVVISYASSGAFQVAQMRKPLVLVDFAGHGIHFTDKLAPVTRAEQLGEAVERAWLNRDLVRRQWQAVLADHIAGKGQEAAAEVAHFLREHVLAQRQPSAVGGDRS